MKSKIATMPSPLAAKVIGRRLNIGKDWDDRRVEYMRAVVTAKFEIPNLREMLLATGDAKLVEGNSWGDKYWGAIWQPETGFVGTSWGSRNGRVLVGQNMLGVILMKLREEINGR